MDMADFLSTGLFNAGGYAPVATPAFVAVPEPTDGWWMLPALIAGSIRRQRR
ncbi:MAG: hypothetical protein ACR2IT_06955 [Pirellulales bacterium]